MQQRTKLYIPSCLLVLLAASHQALASTEEAAPWQGYMSAHEQHYLDNLAQLVAFPSVSALVDAHQTDLQAAAEWLKLRLLSAGMQFAAVLNTTGPHPIVYGHWFSHEPPAATGQHNAATARAEAIAAAAAGHATAPDDVPTLIIYGHYDVQPADPIDLWQSPPFNLTQRDGYLCGRGVDDDKGGVLQAIHAVEALLATAPPRMNIKFFLEGQEEVMSPHLSEFLEAYGHTALLQADGVLSADGGQPAEGQGGISLGLRGIVGMEVEVVTAGTDMHSGMKGGSVANPCLVLAGLLAGLHDPDTGKVSVKGFYQGVTEPDEAERADAAAYVWEEANEARKLGIKAWWGEKGYSTLERRWFRPTLDVVGMTCGFTGQGIKTVLPRTASAKISCRLVGQQQPQHSVNAIRTHLEAAVPPYASLTVKQLGGSSIPWSSPRDLLTNQIAARVSERLLGRKPLYLKDGATIPALASLQQHLGLATTKWGWGLGENIHAPNERLKLSQWQLGHRAWVELLLELAANGKALTAQSHHHDQRHASQAAGAGGTNHSASQHSEL